MIGAEMTGRMMGMGAALTRLAVETAGARMELVIMGAPKPQPPWPPPKPQPP